MKMWSKSSCIKGVEEIFENLPSFNLDNGNEKKYMNGMKIKLDSNYLFDIDRMVRVYKSDNAFVSLAQVSEDETGKYIKSKKFFL